MSLEGAQFICLDEAGNHGDIVVPKGRKFTVGYYLSCDVVITDSRAEGIHCSIESDAFRRISIRNMSIDHPISVNGEILENKRTLFNNATISILDKCYLWLSTSNVDVGSEVITTPKKQIGIPEHAGFSSPSLKTKKDDNRFTVHNFAYCIQSDDEGNVSIGSNKSDDESTVNIAQENQESAQENSSADVPLPQVQKECKEPQETDNKTTKTLEDTTDVSSTPKINLINSTINKENTDSTQKNNRLQLAMCNQSEIVITSFSPRETGVKTEKSFTAIVLPKTAKTPKSVYSTPKSVIGDDHQDFDGLDKSRDLLFHTPSTSKKTLKNSSMHLVDLTTPRKLAPASPYLKSALKASAKKLPMTPNIQKISKNITASDNHLGVSALPCTPSTSDENSNTETPSSVESIISVDSTDTSSVIEILSDASTPGLSTIRTPQKSNVSSSTTPLRTPQSLIKKAIVNRTKQVTTPQRGTENVQTTPRREPINRIPLRSNIAAIRSPITPNPSGSEVKDANRRQSVSTPSRKSFSLAIRFDSSSSSNTKFANPSNARRSLMPKSASKAPMTSTPMRTGANNRYSGCNSTPLNKVRKCVSGVPLSSHISKARKSIIAAAPSNFTSIKEKSPQQKMSDRILHRARKSLGVSPMIARAINMVQTSKEPSNSILKSMAVLTPKSTIRNTERKGKKQNMVRSSTFILDSEDVEPNTVTKYSFANEPDDALQVTSTEEENKINNLTFSPKKGEEEEHPEKVMDEINNTDVTPVDVDVNADITESVQKQAADSSSNIKEATIIEQDGENDLIQIPSTSQASVDSLAKEILELKNGKSMSAMENSDSASKYELCEMAADENRVSTTNIASEIEVAKEDTFMENEASISKVESKIAEPMLHDAEGAMQSHDVLDKSSCQIYKPIYEDITLEGSVIEKDVKDENILEHSLYKAEPDPEVTQNISGESSTDNITEGKNIKLACDLSSTDKTCAELETFVEITEKIVQSPNEKADIEELPSDGVFPEQETFKLLDEIDDVLNKSDEMEQKYKNAIGTITASPENQSLASEKEPKIPSVITISTGNENLNVAKESKDIHNSAENKNKSEQSLSTEQKNISSNSDSVETKDNEFITMEESNSMGSQEANEKHNSEIQENKLGNDSQKECEITEIILHAATIEDQDEKMREEIGPEDSKESACSDENNSSIVITTQNRNEMIDFSKLEKLSENNILQEEMQSKETKDSATIFETGNQININANLIKEEATVSTAYDKPEQEFNLLLEENIGCDENISEVQKDENLTNLNTNAYKNLSESLLSVQTTPRRKSRRLSENKQTNVQIFESTYGASEENITTPKRTTRRNSLSARLDVDTLKTHKTTIENEAESTTTPRRSARKKSMSAEPSVTTLRTPNRTTRRSSITAEISTPHSPAPNTISRTRRSSLSAVSGTPLTPKRMSRRRSSTSLDVDETVKVFDETKDENEATFTISEDIREDMGAIIEEEDEEEDAVSSPLIGKTVTDTDLTEDKEKEIHEEKEDDKVIVEENVGEVIEIHEVAEPTENIQSARELKFVANEQVSDETSQDLTDEITNVENQQQVEEEIMVDVVDVSISETYKDEEIVNKEEKSEEIASVPNKAEHSENVGEVVDFSMNDITEIQDESMCRKDEKAERYSICKEEDLETEIDLAEDEEKRSQSEENELDTTAEEDMETLEVSDSDSVYDYGKEVQMSVTPKSSKKEHIPAKASKDEQKSAKTEKYLLGAKELLTTPKTCSTPRFKGMRELLATPRVSVTPALEGIKELLHSPETDEAAEGSVDDQESLAEYKNHTGSKDLLNTPKSVKKFLDSSATHTNIEDKTIDKDATMEEAEDLTGSKVLLSTQNICHTPRSKGITDLMQVQIVSSTPALEGVKELNDTPNVTETFTESNEDDNTTNISQKSKTITDAEDLSECNKEKPLPTVLIEDITEVEESALNQSISEQDAKEYAGIRELMKTPKSCSTPRFKGMRELMKTPKLKSTPLLGGVKELMNTPQKDTGSLDQFLKTPTAKNIMIPTLPSSAVIEKTEDSVEMVHSIVYDLNDSHNDPCSTSNLGGLFKTPISSRFVDRLSESYADDDHNNSKLNTSETDDKLPAIDSKNTKTNLQTPLKVINRKSLLLTTPLDESSFSTADILTDLSKTEVENWVDKIDPLEQTIDEEDILDCTIKEDSTENDSLGVVPETCVKATLDNVSCSSEAMINVSTVHKTGSKDPLEKSINEESKSKSTKRSQTPIVTADISGIDLLDETTESVMEDSIMDSEDKQAEEDVCAEEVENDLSEPLLLSDDEEIEKDSNVLRETETKNDFTATSEESVPNKNKISEDLFFNDTPEEEENKEAVAIEDEKSTEKSTDDEKTEQISSSKECEDIFDDDSVTEIVDTVKEPLDEVEENSDKEIVNDHIKNKNNEAEIEFKHSEDITSVVVHDLFTLPSGHEAYCSNDVIHILENILPHAKSEHVEWKNEKTSEKVTIAVCTSTNSSDFVVDEMSCDSKDQNVETTKAKYKEIEEDIISIDYSSSEELTEEEGGENCPTRNVESEQFSAKDNGENLKKAIQPCSNNEIRALNDKKEHTSEVEAQTLNLIDESPSSAVIPAEEITELKTTENKTSDTIAKEDFKSLQIKELDSKNAIKIDETNLKRLISPVKQIEFEESSVCPEELSSNDCDTEATPIEDTKAFERAVSEVSTALLTQDQKKLNDMEAVLEYQLPAEKLETSDASVTEDKDDVAQKGRELLTSKCKDTELNKLSKAFTTDEDTDRTMVSQVEDQMETKVDTNPSEIISSAFNVETEDVAADNIVLSKADQTQSEIIEEEEISSLRIKNVENENDEAVSTKTIQVTDQTDKVQDSTIPDTEETSSVKTLRFEENTDTIPDDKAAELEEISSLKIINIEEKNDETIPSETIQIRNQSEKVEDLAIPDTEEISLLKTLCYEENIDTIPSDDDTNSPTVQIAADDKVLSKADQTQSEIIEAVSLKPTSVDGENVCIDESEKVEAKSEIIKAAEISTLKVLHVEKENDEPVPSETIHVKEQSETLEDSEIPDSEGTTSLETLRFEKTTDTISNDEHLKGSKIPDPEETSSMKTLRFEENTDTISDDEVAESATVPVTADEIVLSKADQTQSQTNEAFSLQPTCVKKDIKNVLPDESEKVEAKSEIIKAGETSSLKILNVAKEKDEAVASETTIQLTEQSEREEDSEIPDIEETSSFEEKTDTTDEAAESATVPVAADDIVLSEADQTQSEIIKALPLQPTSVKGDVQNLRPDESEKVEANLEIIKALNVEKENDESVPAETIQVADQSEMVKDSEISHIEETSSLHTLRFEQKTDSLHNDLAAKSSTLPDDNIVLSKAAQTQSEINKDCSLQPTCVKEDIKNPIQLTEQSERVEDAEIPDIEETSSFEEKTDTTDEAAESATVPVAADDIVLSEADQTQSEIIKALPLQPNSVKGDVQNLRPDESEKVEANLEIIKALNVEKENDESVPAETIQVADQSEMVKDSEISHIEETSSLHTLRFEQKADSLHNDEAAKSSTLPDDNIVLSKAAQTQSEINKAFSLKPNSVEGDIENVRIDEAEKADEAEEMSSLKILNVEKENDDAVPSETTIQTIDQSERVEDSEIRDIEEASSVNTLRFEEKTDTIPNDEGANSGTIQVQDDTEEIESEITKVDEVFSSKAQSVAEEIETVPNEAASSTILQSHDESEKVGTESELETKAVEEEVEDSPCHEAKTSKIQKEEAESVKAELEIIQDDEISESQTKETKIIPDEQDASIENPIPLENVKGETEICRAEEISSATLTNFQEESENTTEASARPTVKACDVAEKTKAITNIQDAPENIEIDSLSSLDISALQGKTKRLRGRKGSQSSVCSNESDIESRKSTHKKAKMGNAVNSRVVDLLPDSKEVKATEPTKRNRRNPSQTEKKTEDSNIENPANKTETLKRNRRKPSNTDDVTETKVSAESDTRELTPISEETSQAHEKTLEENTQENENILKSQSPAAEAKEESKPAPKRTRRKGSSDSSHEDSTQTRRPGRRNKTEDKNLEMINESNENKDMEKENSKITEDLQETETTDGMCNADEVTETKVSAQSDTRELTPISEETSQAPKKTLEENTQENENILKSQSPAAEAKEESKPAPKRTRRKGSSDSSHEDSTQTRRPGRRNKTEDKNLEMINESNENKDMEKENSKVTEDSQETETTDGMCNTDEVTETKVSAQSDTRELTPISEETSQAPEKTLEENTQENENILKSQSPAAEAKEESKPAPKRTRRKGSSDSSHEDSTQTRRPGRRNKTEDKNLEMINESNENKDMEKENSKITEDLQETETTDGMCNADEVTETKVSAQSDTRELTPISEETSQAPEKTLEENTQENENILKSQSPAAEAKEESKPAPKRTRRKGSSDSSHEDSTQTRRPGRRNKTEDKNLEMINESNKNKDMEKENSKITEDSQETETTDGMCSDKTTKVTKAHHEETLNRRTSRKASQELNSENNSKPVKKGLNSQAKPNNIEMTALEEEIQNDTQIEEIEGQRTEEENTQRGAIDKAQNHGTNHPPIDEKQTNDLNEENNMQSEELLTKAKQYVQPIQKPEKSAQPDGVTTKRTRRKTSQDSDNDVGTSKSSNKYHKTAESAETLSKIDESGEKEIAIKSQHNEETVGVVTSVDETNAEDHKVNEKETVEQPSAPLKRIRRKAIQTTTYKEQSLNPQAEQDPQLVSETELHVIHEDEKNNVKLNAENEDGSMTNESSQSKDEKPSSRSIKRPLTTSDLTDELTVSGEPELRRAKLEENNLKQEALAVTSNVTQQHQTAAELSTDELHSDTLPKAPARRRAAPTNLPERDQKIEKTKSRTRRVGKAALADSDHDHQLGHEEDKKSTSKQKRGGRSARGAKEKQPHDDDNKHLDQHDAGDEKSTAPSEIQIYSNDPKSDEALSTVNEKETVEPVVGKKAPARSRNVRKAKTVGEELHGPEEKPSTTTSRRGRKVQHIEEAVASGHQAGGDTSKEVNESHEETLHGLKAIQHTVDGGEEDHGHEKKITISRTVPKAKNTNDTNDQSDHHKEVEPHDEKSFDKSSNSNKAFEEGQNNLSKKLPTRTRRGRNAAHDVEVNANHDEDHSEEEAMSSRRKRAPTHEISGPSSRRKAAARKKVDHDANVSSDDITLETTGTKNTDINRKKHENETETDNPTQTEQKVDTSHTQTIELNTTSDESLTKRGRNVPQRRAAKCHQSYDETSDSEKTDKKKKKTESEHKPVEAAKNPHLEMLALEHSSISSPSLLSPVTARGRTRKHTPKVQQFLEEKRAKTGSPKKRAAETKGKGRNKDNNDDDTTSPVSTKVRKVTRKAIVDVHHIDVTEEPSEKKLPAAIEAEKEKGTSSSDETATPTRMSAKRNAATAARLMINDQSLVAEANEPVKKSRARKQPMKASTSAAKRDHRLVSPSTLEEDDGKVEITAKPLKEETKTTTKRGGARKAATSSTQASDAKTEETSLPAKRGRKVKAVSSETHDNEEEEQTSEPISIHSAESLTKAGRRNVHFESADQNQESSAADEPATTANKRKTRTRRI